MAREYGQLRHDIWNDDDWLDLTVPAQHLYMTLLSDPTLSYCGVTDWRPGRVAQRAADNPTRATILAAQELSYAYFIVVDEETEEVLIRSYLRHDPILKNPRLAVTMTKDFGAVGSRKIRAALVYELQRLKKANPDWAAWERPQVKTILRQSAVNPKELVTDLEQGSATYLPSLLGSTLPSDIESAEIGFTPRLQQQRATATATATSPKEDAAGSGKGSSPGSSSRKRKSDKAAGEGCPDHQGYPLPCDRCAESAVA